MYLFGCFFLYSLFLYLSIGHYLFACFLVCFLRVCLLFVCFLARSLIRCFVRSKHYFILSLSLTSLIHFFLFIFVFQFILTTSSKATRIRTRKNHLGDETALSQFAVYRPTLCLAILGFCRISIVPVSFPCHPRTKDYRTLSTAWGVSCYHVNLSMTRRFLSETGPYFYRSSSRLMETFVDFCRVAGVTC